MPINRQDYQFLLKELQSGNLTPEQQDAAIPLLEEYQSKDQAPKTFFHPASTKLSDLPRAVGSGIVSLGAGAADMVLGAAEAVADLNPLWDAEAMAERRDSVAAGAALINNQLYEKSVGRPLTSEEAQQVTEMTAKGVQLGSNLAKVGTGVAGGAAAVGGKTFLGSLGIGTTEGALTGVLLGEVDEDSEDARFAQRIGDAAWGAAFGAVGSTLPALASGGKNLFDKIIRRASENADEAAATLPRFFGLPSSLGQRSGNPVILNIENAAKGINAQRFLARQAESLPYKIAAKAGLRLRPLAEIGEGNTAKFQQVTKQLGFQIGKAKQARDEAWRAAMRQIDDQFRGAEVFASDDLAKVADDIAREFTDDPAKYGAQKYFVEMLDKLREGGNLTAKELGELQVDLNKIQSASLKAFSESDHTGTAQALAGQLKRALQKGLDDAADSAPIQAIKAVRRDYSTASDNIAQLERDTFQALGFSGNPGETLKRLKGADTANVRSAMKLLRQTEGGELYRRMLEQAVFDEAVNAGSIAAGSKAARTGDFDVKAFANAFSKGAKKSVLEGISDPERAKIAAKGAKLARVVMNDPDAVSAAGVIKTQLGLDLPGVFINAIERHPGFVARLLAGAVTRGKGADWLFWTEDGIKVLETLRDTRVAGKAVKVPAHLRNAGIMYATSSLKAGAIEDLEQQEQEAPE